MFEWLSRAYLTTDRRLLGFFRIYFGLVLLGDLYYHAGQATLFYSNDGFMPNHSVLFHPQSVPQFSFLFACSTPKEAKFAFALIGIVYFLYLIGFKTKAMQVLAFVAVTSIDSRNLFAEDGGCITTNLVSAWTLFLPLGDRFSLDALLRRARGDDPIVPEHRVKSFAVLGIALQAATIYYFNAVHKDGWAWVNGEAVHQVLWQNRCNTPFAAWFRAHEPMWFSPLATKLTLIVEINLPVLILMPIARRVNRTVAFLLAVGLHGTIAMLMTLGIFSYVMIALMMLVIPAETIDDLAPFVEQSRLAKAIRQYSDRAVEWLRENSIHNSWAWAPDVIAKRGRIRFWASNVVAIVLWISVTLQGLNENTAVPAWAKIRPPVFFWSIVQYPRLLQGWRMFAPDTPYLDGILVVDATTESGKHIDPMTGEAPDFEMNKKGPFKHSILVADFIWGLGSDRNADARDDFKDYLRRWHQVHHRPDSDRIVHYDAWLLMNNPPERGSYEIGPIRKDLVFSGP